MLILSVWILFYFRPRSTCTNKLSASFVMTHDNDNNNDRTLRYRLGNKNNHYRGLRVASHHTSPRISLITPSSEHCNYSQTFSICIYGKSKGKYNTVLIFSLFSVMKWYLTNHVCIFIIEINVWNLSRNGQWTIINSSSTFLLQWTRDLVRVWGLGAVACKCMNKLFRDFFSVLIQPLNLTDWRG